MFNPFPHPLHPVSDSPKPSTFSSKSGVYSLRNLTVLSLDLLRCIVFKDRFAFVLSLNAGFIITKHPPFVKPFFQISDIFCIPQHVVFHSKQHPPDVVVLPDFSNRSGSIFFVKKQFF